MLTSTRSLLSGLQLFLTFVLTFSFLRPTISQNISSALNSTTGSIPAPANNPTDPTTVPSFKAWTNTTQKKSLIKFSSPQAQAYYVDGRKIPFVDWDAGPSYAGLIPVSDAPNESRKFFFWFWPAATITGVNDLTFWTNGGPGCSSLESLLQETGPISWKYGQASPSMNSEAWTFATSMLYVEQPIGTGYTEGEPQAQNQTDISRDLYGFFQQWLGVFPEMKNKNFFLSGESYAGYYIPYFADYIYARQEQFALKLQGIYLVNPSLSWPVLRSQISVVPYVKRYEHVFAFNRTFMNQIEALHQQCGYADYLGKYKAYPPPPGPFPIPSVGTFEEGQPSNTTCDVYQMIFDAANLANPAFNPYQILDTPPAFWDVLDAPQRWPGMEGDSVYFNRDDVKRTLHIPLTKVWKECNKEVFPHGDQSIPPALSVLPSVIERSNRSIIVQGQTDFMILFDGTQLTLQNMTWASVQGFQKPIEDDFIVSGQGASGRFSTERGFTYVELEKCGHMVPQYQPRAAMQLLRYMLGRTESPSAPWPS